MSIQLMPRGVNEISINIAFHIKVHLHILWLYVLVFYYQFNSVEKRVKVRINGHYVEKMHCIHYYQTIHTPFTIKFYSHSTKAQK